MTVAPHNEKSSVAEINREMDKKRKQFDLIHEKSRTKTETHRSSFKSTSNNTIEKEKMSSNPTNCNHDQSKQEREKCLKSRHESKDRKQQQVGDSLQWREYANAC